MKTINTLCGEVEVSKLGVISPHEHILIDLTNQFVEPKTDEQIEISKHKVNINNLDILRRNPYAVKDNLCLNSIDTAIYELGFLKRVGGNTVIDLTLRGIGRDVRNLKMVSQETGVNIVAGCGLYTYDTVSEQEEAMSVDQLAKHFIEELTVGIDGTNIKAGIIGEIGTSDYIRPVEERSLRAAAVASVKTGTPIYVHIYPWGKEGLKSLDILGECGVRAKDVCICHVDVEFDYDYITSVLKRGAYIEFDNFGKEFYILKEPGDFAGGSFARDVERVHVIKRLVEDGYEDNILLANDVCLKELLHSYGGWGYDHVMSNIMTMMVAEGIDKYIVEKLVKKNPNNFLSGN
jgi:phosphotriesterase-related protein